MQGGHVWCCVLPCRETLRMGGGRLNSVVFVEGVGCCCFTRYWVLTCLAVFCICVHVPSHTTPERCERKVETDCCRDGRIVPLCSSLMKLG